MPDGRALLLEGRGQKQWAILRRPRVWIHVLLQIKIRQRGAMLGQRPRKFVPGNLAANAWLGAHLIGPQKHEKRDQARENDFKNGRAHGWGCEARMIHDGSIVLTGNFKVSLNHSARGPAGLNPLSRNGFAGWLVGG